MECIYRGVIGNSCSSLGLAPISISDPFGLWHLQATSGVFSKVARRGLVFQLKGTASSPPQFSLGHADWGVLMWPLELCYSDDEVEYYTLQCDAGAKWDFLHEPQDWKVGNGACVAIEHDLSSVQSIFLRESAGCYAEGPNVSWQPIYSFTFFDCINV